MCKYICEFCKKELKNKNALAQHRRQCKYNPDYKFDKEKNNLYLYHKNNRENNIKSHSLNRIAINKDNKIKYIKPDELEQYINLGWEKGVSQSFRDIMVNTNKNSGRASTNELEQKRRQKISETMKKNPLAGGLRRGSGKGKKGWYKGIFCDSSWELAFVIWNLDNNKNITRCTERRKYIYNGEEHIYIPDFVIDNNLYEIKGYVTKQWLAKYEYNKDIKVLYFEDIKPYLDYVISKYGEDFTKLYDK